LLDAAKKDVHWFADSDVHDIVFGIFQWLVNIWKKLRTHSEDELGALAEEGAAETVKQQAQWSLEDLRGWMVRVGYDERVPVVPKLPEENV
jgi:hypothetical protein